MADAAPTLEHLVDLAAQLERDRSVPDAVLRARDREIGRATADATPRAHVIAWLERVRGEAGPGATAVAARRWVMAGLVALGALMGVGAARVVYFYDGSRPVNVIEVLAFFVGVQLLLVGVTAVGMLPAGWRRRLPVIGALQDALGVLSPGRWQAGLMRVLPQTQREALAFALGRGRAHQKLYGGVQRWAVLVGSQSFAVAFHTGALATCLVLISFTDLAFGWSTTLEVEPARLHRVTELVSTPWAAFAPDARPSIALIEATRYFRLGRGSLPGEGTFDSVDPAALGGWWPFCAASMIAYGLLPRLALWAYARRRFTAEVARAFDRMPGLPDLLDRLDRPLVQTAAAEPDAAAPSPPAGAASHPALGLEQRRCAVVNWSGVALDDASLASLVARTLHTEVTGVAAAGGGRSWSDDCATIRGLAGASAVAIAVRAWEPPVLEIVDFAAELRGVLGDATPIVVVPLGVGAAAGETAPAPSDLAQWTRRIDAAGDPWLAVRSPAEAA